MSKKNPIEFILTALAITVVTVLGIVIVLRARSGRPPEKPSFKSGRLGKTAEPSNYDIPVQASGSRNYEYSIDATKAPALSSRNKWWKAHTKKP